MMYVGIDVGETTGLAFVSDTGEVVATHTLREEDLVTSKVLSMISAAPETYDVCIEFPAATNSGYRKSMREIVLHFMTRFPYATRVQPGTWKQSAVMVQQFPPGPLSQHEKDAIMIARWRRAHKEQEQE